MSIEVEPICVSNNNIRFHCRNLFYKANDVYFKLGIQKKYCKIEENID